MAEAHRALVLVLEADRTTDLGVTGLADLVGHHFADVTTGGRAHEMLGNAGCKPARAVGCVSPVNRRLGRHNDVWEAPRVTLRRCRGCSASYDSQWHCESCGGGE